MGRGWPGSMLQTIVYESLDCHCSPMSISLLTAQSFWVTEVSLGKDSRQGKANTWVRGQGRRIGQRGRQKCPADNWKIMDVGVAYSCIITGEPDTRAFSGIHTRPRVTTHPKRRSIFPGSQNKVSARPLLPYTLWTPASTTKILSVRKLFKAAVAAV